MNKDRTLRRDGLSVKGPVWVEMRLVVWSVLERIGEEVACEIALCRDLHLLTLPFCT